MRHLVAIACAALMALPARAAPSARSMYGDAMAREKAVRVALADPSASESMLKAVRDTIAAYEAVVRHYPASSYSDNAWWQAGRLSLDAFERFGQPRDKDAAVRLLRLLASEYPTSKLAKQVPEQLAALSDSASAPPATASAVARARESTLERELPERVGVGRPRAPVRDTGAPSAAYIAVITGIRRTVLPDAVRVTIEIDAEVASFREERISGPARIFIDFASTRAAPGLVEQTLRFDHDGDVVRQIRIGRHPNATTRVVLDAMGVSGYAVYPLYNPYRLVIDCVREAAPAIAVAAPAAHAMSRAVPPASALAPHPARELARPALTGHRLRSEWGRTLPATVPSASTALDDAYVVALKSHGLGADWSPRLPVASPVAAAAIADAVAPVAADSSAVPPLSAPLAATASPAPGRTPRLGGSHSMARQLGLGVSRIVIDPGHGGHDSGAKGKGVTEAEIVLDVSLRLRKLLEKVDGVEVILTRTTDEFVPLQERTAIANREGADLFLSIHANASANDQTSGIETYVLNFANNLSAAAVATRENAASGQAMGALPDFVKAIALNNKLDESRNFATRVQHAMVERLRGANKTVKSLGVKQAPFVVLIGASMPSVLTEISFLTNTREAKLLKSSAYRQRIAEALFSAVRKYQTSLTPVHTVAEQ